MEIQAMVHKMIWIGIDGLGAVWILSGIYRMFFSGGFSEVIGAFGAALCG